MLVQLAHADWSVDRRKCRVAVARSAASGWTASAPTEVGSSGDLRRRLGVDEGDLAVLGFDFPIGVPRAYATAIGVESFPSFLRSCPSTFFEVADDPSEIGLDRPFFPNRVGGRKRDQLTAALGLAFDDLRRRCERRVEGRGAACPLFWTLGGNQVGKGALAGWRLLREEPSTTRLWPFDGSLDDLLASRDATVVVETYPTDAAARLGIGPVRGKGKQDVRRRHAAELLEVAAGLEVELERELRRQVLDGFGSARWGEDAFDAVLGLLGMVAVLSGRLAPGPPAGDPALTSVEGWILGMPER